MEHSSVRTLTRQLADDLAWLEDHARHQPRAMIRAGELHLTAAAVRNVLAPFLERQPPLPLHVAVVGGAGAGKSTVANFLCGQMLAESNPQAGFTRHPIAYAGATAPLPWPGTLGFLGNLHRLDKPESASLDADVYQLRRVPYSPEQFSVLDKFVVWDCPDMTTWAAAGYVPRLLEVAGLADVIVYVASDERYNDEVPTQFLRALLDAGKAVVVCLVKMKEADVLAFTAHFQREVMAGMPRPAVAVMAIPHLTTAQLADPAASAPYRIPLVNQISVLGEPVDAARRRSVESGLQALAARQAHLLDVARHDLEAIETWQQLVKQGQIEFDGRYRREFLTAERFQRFDEALVRLLELLELPGVGRVLSTTLYFLRTPYRLLKGLFNKTLLRPDAAGLPERRVLEDALGGWLDLLRKEATRRADNHPLWQHVHQGFGGGLADQTRDRFEQAFRGFQLGLADEVERTARAIYLDLEQNPVALNTLRGTKFTMEVAAIGGTIAAGGLHLVDLVLVPLAASVMNLLVELMGRTYVERRREQTRLRQEAMVTQYVSGPIADWLTNWPTSGGSSYDRLQQVLRRFPQDVKRLEAAVHEALK